MITRLLVIHSTLPRHEIIYFSFILFYSILFYSILPNFFFSILFLKASRNLGLENAKISRCFFDTSNGNYKAWFDGYSNVTIPYSSTFPPPPTF